jgi:DNA-binding CsgD family transcriptional regulator
MTTAKTDMTTLDARSERILELLSKGASSRDLADKLGYQEGTMRVYLHHLYRKLGVANKTEAVIWYMRRAQGMAAPTLEASVAAAPTDDLFGEMALREGLYASLGVMSLFLGPFSRVWEVGQRLAGNEPDDEALQRRDRCRALWKALLSGDWAEGKRAYDAGVAETMLVSAAADAVLLAALLALGGYTSAAQRVIAGLSHKRRLGNVSARETSMLKALVGAMEGEGTDGLAELHSLTTEKAGVRQVAMVVLFHAYASRKDAERARKTANAIWNDAEAAKQQLVAMGERPFATTRGTPAPEKAPARRAPAREKALAR